jgi:hypothetical protein
MATYEEIKEQFEELVRSDKRANDLYTKIRSGKGTYKTASQLAIRLGTDLGRVLKQYAPEDGSVWDIDIDDLLPRALGLDHRKVIEACREVQNLMNKDAGLGIKFQEPKFNTDRAFGIVAELKEHENFADISKSFYDQLVNFSQNIVDDSIRDNAMTMWRAGIKAQVIRQHEFKACEWCQNVAGAYDYIDVRDTGNDVWRRHENCRCTIDYVTERNSGLYSERVNNFKK